MRHRDSVELRLQLLDFCFLGGGGALQFVQAFCISERGRGFSVAFCLCQFIGERITLFFHGAEGLGDGELARDFAGIDFGLERLNLGVFVGCSLLQGAGGLGFSQRESVFLVAFGQFKAVV